jgi:DNA-binding transcriptional regulator GbsR (MarR family)
LLGYGSYIQNTDEEDILMTSYTYDLFKTTDFLICNNEFAKKFGWNTTAFFSFLASKFKYFCSTKALKDGWFYMTIGDVFETIGLSRKEQDAAIDKLSKEGLLTKKVMKLSGDVSQRRYFKISNDIELLSKYICLDGIKSQDSHNLKYEGINQCNDSVGESVEKNRQIESVNLDLSNCPKQADINKINNNINKTKKDYIFVDQSIKEALNKINYRLTDDIEKIFEQIQIDKSNNAVFKQLVRSAVTISFKNLSTRSIIKQVNIDCILEAYRRFDIESKRQYIKNTIMYFTKCLLSVIEENLLLISSA